MRRESKLMIGTVPRSNPHWPLEREVLQLFATLSPDFAERAEAERIAKLPRNRRIARQAALGRRPKTCPLKK
jgi:hypothetical protein